MKKYSILALILLFLSCNKKEIKEYYGSGSLKSIRNVDKNGKTEGLYKEFYEDGQLKTVHKYRGDQKVDSSIYYYPEGKIKDIRYWNDSTNVQKKFSKTGQLIGQGETKNNDLNFRIGSWKFSNGQNDSIVEYIAYNKKPYVNQFWTVSSKGDTLNSKSNYYRLIISDTVVLGEVARMRFFLRAPYYGEDSEVEVLLPFYDEDLNTDFSNINEIEVDRFPSLKNDGIPHPEIPRGAPIDKIVEFGLTFDEIGEYKLRGSFVEYYFKNDSSQRIERQLFFNDKIYVVQKPK